MKELLTPLEHLFLYIRDIFGNSLNCFDFQQEPNNEKTKGLNYWPVDALKEIAKKARQKNITEIEFALTSDAAVAANALLIVKRTTLPPKPEIPAVLKEWLDLNEKDLCKPVLLRKKSIEQKEKFEDAPQRVKALDDFWKNAKELSTRQPIPASLEEWVKYTSEGEIKVIPERKIIIQFEDDKNRVQLHKQFEQAFDQYYASYEIPLRINGLYDSLHKLYYDLKGRENIKPYLSFGLLQGEIGNQWYNNFLFHIPLKLSLKKQEIKIEFDTFGNKLFAEQHFTELFDEQFKDESATAIESKKQDVLKAVNDFNSRQVQFLFEKELIRNVFFEPALDILKVFPNKNISFFEGDELNLAFNNAVVEKKISFSFSPIIQSKLSEAKIKIANDANNIANKIYELRQNNEIDQIPDFFKKLFSLETPDEPETAIMDASDHGHAVNGLTIIEPIKYLFPLPVNDEQGEIAKRLHEQDAVTVKGPPGTGKSHTIANLISHFVAQGKSILIVSHNSKALSVIKDKLPHGIQELAISLVNEGQGQERLKASVNAIIGNISNKFHDEKKVEVAAVELQQLEKRYQEELNKVYNLIQSNNETFEIWSPFSKIPEKKTAAHWAEYIFNQQFEAPSFMKDDIYHFQETHSYSSNLLELMDTGRRLRGEEFELHRYVFSERALFMEVEEVRKAEERLQQILHEIDPDDFKKVNHELFDAPFFETLAGFNDQLKKIRSNTISAGFVTSKQFNYEELVSLLADNDHQLRQLQQANQVLLNYQLDITPLANSHPFELAEEIDQLIEKFGDNKTLGFLTKKLLSKQLARFLECKVNFSEATTVDKLKIIELEIHRQKIAAQLTITFTNYFQLKQLGTVTDVNESIDQLKDIVAFVEGLGRFNQVLELKKLKPLDLRSAGFDDDLSLLNRMSLYVQYKNIQQAFKAKAFEIRRPANQHPVIKKISDALESANSREYEMYLEEYFRYSEIAVMAKKYDDGYRSLRNELPKTVAFVDNHVRAGKEVFAGKDQIEQEIFLVKLKSFLQDTMNGGPENKRYFDELQFIKKNIEKKTAQLIVAKTWLHKSEQIESKELSALNAWLNDLIKVGKGMGKNVNRDYASAISNMQIAKRAVPIWIMPLDSAITFFPDCSPNQFDLLIIDEASQCDISSLNLIFRAKKTLIVGDENQTSVITDRSITIDRTNVLLNKYLYNHQFRTQFDVTSRISSVYAMASVVYPNILTLKEHFRCLPEIIGFSNQHIYGNTIIPLKTAMDKVYGEPLEVRYVEDDITADAKPAIVESILQSILQIIQDYNERKIPKLPTIGVIVLDSSNIAHIRELIQRIAGHPLIKYHEDELDFMVGTSREFQGDERDIIFLTITATHKLVQNGSTVTIRPPVAITSEEYMRIYNVATSRAREKSILYHSIHPEAVPAINPECYRKKILDYYANYNRGDNGKAATTLQDLLNKVDPNAGPFERSVCTFLFNNRYGNYLHPQYNVGNYTIDFGIIIKGKKLAIECDGYMQNAGLEKIKEDIKRQQILERAGWQFFRVQSTEWFYRNEQVGQKLLSWLYDNAESRIEV